MLSESEKVVDVPLADAQGSSDVLRIALDKDAVLAYEKMKETLKTESFVRLSPSKFISYLTNFFYLNYFEKDKELILSEFFDSKEYVESEIKKAKNSSEITVILERSMERVRRMQDLKNGGTSASRKKRRNVSAAHEK